MIDVRLIAKADGAAKIMMLAACKEIDGIKLLDALNYQALEYFQLEVDLKYKKIHRMIKKTLKDK